MSMDPREEQVLGKAYDGRLMRRLLVYIAPYRSSAVLALLLIISAAVLSILPPYLTKIAIDRYIQNHDLAGLNRVAALYVGILVAVLGLTYGQTMVMNLMGQKIMYDLRMQIFRHLEACTLSGIVVTLFVLDFRLALAIFSVLPLLFLVTFTFKIKVRDSFRRVRTAIARINTFLQENITGTAVVQIFGQEKKQFEKFTRINCEHLEANLQSIFYYAVFYPLLELVGALAVALIVWYGGFKVLSGTLTLGALVAFIQYSDRFFRPISDLSEKYTILQAAMASSERIFKLLDTPPSIVSRPDPRTLRVRSGHVEFRGVHFAYHPGDEVLHDVSFAVEPGEKVAIVGPTGAGKSTIISLLSRFYDIQQGQVLIDGVDIRDYDLQALRLSVGIVLQDVFLFSGSIANNIRLGNTEISDEQLRRAAEIVHASEFVEKLKAGYEARVGERGSSLSVGQKQLLAFARALAYDPGILVLDEATSSIDTETELLIRDAIEKLMVGRTCIIIAHRLSTIQNADRIIVLHRGRIREMGTHQELLKLKGIYWKLYQLQYKDQLVTSQA